MESLADQLHDGPVQWIVGAKLQVEALRAALATGKDIELAELDQLLATLQRALSQTRLLMQGWYGPKLDDGCWHAPLREDLQLAIAGLPRQTPALQLDWHTDTEPLPPLIARAVYRIAREALWNALRHSGASHVACRIARQGPRLSIEVDDDGRGIPWGQVTTDRRGLRGIAARAHLAGGVAAVESSVAGTRWKVEIPLPHSAAGSFSESSPPKAANSTASSVP